MRQLGLGTFELVLVCGLYVVYRLGRILTVDRTETARAHARLVHHLERVLQLPSEAAIQHAVTANQWLLDGLVAVALLGVALLVVPRPSGHHQPGFG